MMFCYLFTRQTVEETVRRFQDNSLLADNEKMMLCYLFTRQTVEKTVRRY